MLRNASININSDINFNATSIVFDGDFIACFNNDSNFFFDTNYPKHLYRGSATFFRT